MNMTLPQLVAIAFIAIWAIIAVVNIEGEKGIVKSVVTGFWQSILTIVIFSAGAVASIYASGNSIL